VQPITETTKTYKQTVTKGQQHKTYAIKTNKKRNMIYEQGTSERSVIQLKEHG